MEYNAGSCKPSRSRLNTDGGLDYQHIDKSMNANKTMKKFLALGCVLSVGLSGALAIPQVTLSTFDSGSSGNYRADPNAELEYVIGNYANGLSTDGVWFGTFCMEKNEFFNPGHTYDVVLNDGATNGGKGGVKVGNKDIISKGTAYLYEQFALGTLTDFTYGDSTHASQLQNTF